MNYLPIELVHWNGTHEMKMMNKRAENIYETVKKMMLQKKY